MKLLAIVTIIFLAAGCENRADWSTAASEYDCSEDAWPKVEKETLFCSNNTGYLASYCYGTAILRNCSKIDASQDAGEQCN